MAETRKPMNYLYSLFSTLVAHGHFSEGIYAPQEIPTYILSIITLQVLDSTYDPP